MQMQVSVSFHKYFFMYIRYVCVNSVKWNFYVVCKHCMTKTTLLARIRAQAGKNYCRKQNFAESYIKNLPTKYILILNL